MLLSVVPIFLVVFAVGTESASLICPKNVNSFSAGHDVNIFYRCSGKGLAPILEKCPHGKIYSPYKGECYANNVTSNPELNTFTQKVLGRQVLLGDLYDGRSNNILSGASLWKARTIEDNERITSFKSEDANTFISDSINDRLRNLKVTPALELDYLSGMVEVSGSAGYLEDPAETDQTVNVVLKYFATTHYHTLPWTTGVDYKNLCVLKEATHFISSITYGLRSFFLFKKKVKAGHDRQIVAENLLAAVEAIPGFAGARKGELNISRFIQEITSDVHVKFYGDILLRRQPTDYATCISVYRNITDDISRKPQYAETSKVSMGLVPITRVCDNQAVLTRISVSLTDSIKDMLLEIRELKQKASNIALADCIHQYSPLRTIIHTFIKKLNLFEDSMKGELQVRLPKVRAGASDNGESALVDLLTRYANSPFNYKAASAFLNTRYREVSAVDYLLEPDNFKDTAISILDYKGGNDIKILLSKPVVVMLKLNILPSPHIIEKFLNKDIVDESKAWFNDDKVVAEIGMQFHRFTKFASANVKSSEHGFLFAMAGSKLDTSTIYAQKKGEITYNFTIPEVTEKIDPIGSTHESILFAVRKPRNPWIIGFIVSYQREDKRDSLVERKYSFVNQHITEVEISGLAVDTAYTVAVGYTTAMGKLTIGSYRPALSTRPCVAPSNVRIENLSSNTFYIKWDRPIHKVEKVDIKYEITITGADYNKSRTIREPEFECRELDPASLFIVNVQAVVTKMHANETVALRSLPSITNVTTRPMSPTPSLLRVGCYWASIKWRGPAKIPVGSVVRGYLVKYGEVTMNAGNETSLTETLLQSTNITLTDLLQGTEYAVSVKVLTSLESSDYSSKLIIKTRFNETELDQLKDKVEAELDQLKDKVFKKIKINQQEISTINRNLDNKITSNTEEIQSSTRKLSKDIKEESSKLTKTISKNKADIEEESATVKANKASVKDLTSKMEYMYGIHIVYYPEGTRKHMAFKEYPIYKAKFIGYGYGAHFTGYTTWLDLTVEGCVMECHRHVVSGDGVNAFRYITRATTNKCLCMKGSTGFTHTPDRLLYRYE